MTIAITTGLVVFVVVALFLFVTRRILRLAVKLALVCVLVFLLLGGATLGWWRGWFGSASQSGKKPTPTNQKVNSNRRPPAR
jgi:heme A synthase